MKTATEITLTGRHMIARFLDKYSVEQLNKVPDGFSNNLIWNAGHVVVVQQMLVYGLSGLPMMVAPEMVAQYKRGTRPDRDVTAVEVQQIRDLLLEPVVQAQRDFTMGRFGTYQEFTTMTGHTLRSAYDAMMFNYYHEAIHTGVMMSIAKFI